jgi:primary-amine oxidase
MILYQGHVSEVFVPYMDSSEAWYFRTPMDVGEFGLGMLASPLAPGIDCPDDALFIDADIARPTGSIYHRPRVLCVFERDAKAPLWRHWEALNGRYAGRRASELVVRAIPSIGNYDYVIDWVFTQKGEIEVNIGATGIDAVKGVDYANVQDASDEQARGNGMLVAPNLVAVHHDHYFSIRLDLDVDGPVNNFVRERLQPHKAEGEQRRHIWQLERVPVEVEGAVTARKGAEFWRVESTGAKTGLGHQPSYQLTGGGVTSMFAGQDWPHRRGAFAGESLWVTSHKAGELFASGQYPNQNGSEDGVQAYVNGEDVQAADIVVWYTVGFNHLTRPEDWPVLSTIWHGMKLRPYGFFEKNPSISGPE